MGVGVSGFEAGAPKQLSLMPAKEPEKDEARRGRLNMAVDALRSRYAAAPVMRGRLFEAQQEEDPAETSAAGIVPRVGGCGRSTDKKKKPERPRARRSASLPRSANS